MCAYWQQIGEWTGMELPMSRRSSWVHIVIVYLYLDRKHSLLDTGYSFSSRRQMSVLLFPFFHLSCSGVFKNLLLLGEQLWSRHLWTNEDFIRRLLPYGIWRRVTLLNANVWEQHITSIFRVTNWASYIAASIRLTMDREENLLQRPLRSCAYPLHWSCWWGALASSNVSWSAFLQ
jgi:hypothetical protein